MSSSRTEIGLSDSDHDEAAGALGQIVVCHRTLLSVEYNSIAT